MKLKKKRATDKLVRKRQTSIAPTEPTLPDAEEYNTALEEQAVLAERKKARKIRVRNILRRAAGIFLVVCSLYLAFLIYGVINTEFYYTENGEISARRMTVQKIEQLENFNDLSVQYRQARYLYERVLVLDYRIAAAVEDPLTVAPEYEKLLTDIESLAIQIGAVELEAEYTQTLTMLQKWVENDIAIYCQNMSRAISQNNEEYAANALEYKTIMYQDFSVITQNLLVLGDGIEGADIQDISEWSPEKYIEESIGAYGN